jgi:hypothetical protein
MVLLVLNIKKAVLEYNNPTQPFLFLSYLILTPNIMETINYFANYLSLIQLSVYTLWL